MIKINYQLTDNKHSLTTGFWMEEGILYPIAQTHIRAVLDMPEIFNREKSELIRIYKKYNEKIGFEGKARKEIILSLVQEGWIRIRFYLQPKRHLRIQCIDPDQQNNEIEKFLDYTQRNLGLQEDDEVRVGV